MRLVCPNCAAQYEVDPALIPEGGRDVQCSSCGETWFAGRDERAAPAAPPPDSAPPPPAAEAPGKAPEDLAEDGVDETPEAAPPQETPSPLPRRRIDEAALAILREEAEREAAERRRDAGGAFDSQGDLGLEEDVQARRRVTEMPAPQPAEPEEHEPEAPAPTDAVPPSPAEAPAVDPAPPMADASAPPAEDDPANAGQATVPEDRPAARDRAGSRRDLLPDIEEINSTLTATSARVPGPTDPVAQAQAEDRQRHGFRLAFSLVMAITAVLLLLYAFAPQIVQALPGTEGAMIGYVRWANGVWDGLDRLLAGAGAALTDSAN